MKKTLVIHPDDRSTDFLKICYENHLNDWTIINDCEISKKELIKAILEHDRIIMMGHGCPSGLFNPKYYTLLIDSSIVPLLTNKETVSIWCHSDQFFEKYALDGFHTGMIISEVGESNYVLGYSPFNKKEMLENMNMFARSIRDCIDGTPEEMKEYVLSHYVADDAITKYNRSNIKVLSFEKEKLYKYNYNFNEDLLITTTYNIISKINNRIIYVDDNGKKSSINYLTLNSLTMSTNYANLYTSDKLTATEFEELIKSYLKKKIENIELEKNKYLTKLHLIEGE